MKKRFLIVLAAVAVLALAAVSVVSADEPVAPEGRFPRIRHALGQLGSIGEFLGLTPEEMQTAREEGKTVADLAEEQGIALDDLISDVITTPPPSIQERFDRAVENGSMTQEEANEKLAALREGMTNRFSGEMPERPSGETPERRDGEKRSRSYLAFDTLGDIIGLEPQEILEAMKDGTTAAELIEEQGLSVDDVIAEMSESLVERLDQAVENDKLTQAEADAKLATFQETLAERMTTPMDEWPEPVAPRPETRPQQRGAGSDQQSQS